MVAICKTASWFRHSFCLATIIFSSLSNHAPTCFALQSDEVSPQAVQTDKSDGIQTPPQPDVEIDKQFAQLHLQDGSIIGGKIKTAAIHVDTEFGTLTVPIESIVRITPGLNNRSELLEHSKRLVEQLGDSNIDKQQEAKKELLAMGPEISNFVKLSAGQGNASQQKLLSEVIADLSEQMSRDADESNAKRRSSLMEDTVATTDFEIVGEIQEKQFELTSKFGVLNVQLGDIKLATREIGNKTKAIRKLVSVDGMAFFQSKPISTKIRINTGDRINIKADGVVQWTNWNSSSTPEGITNRGQWNGINSGKLVARVGSNNSRCVQIGSQGDFVAKSSGTLYLGIAMRDSYASNTGYSWTGQYKAKITINEGGGR